MQIEKREIQMLNDDRDQYNTRHISFATAERYLRRFGGSHRPGQGVKEHEATGELYFINLGPTLYNENGNVVAFITEGTVFEDFHKWLDWNPEVKPHPDAVDQAKYRKARQRARQLRRSGIWENHKVQEIITQEYDERIGELVASLFGTGYYLNVPGETELLDKEPNDRICVSCRQVPPINRYPVCNNCLKKSKRRENPTT